MSLRKKTFSSVRATATSVGIKSILQLLQVGILARYLDSGDFGLMALVLVAISFAMIFTDLGVSNAIIHFQEISSVQLSSLFWVNVLAGLAATISLYLLSPVIASFYEQPRLEPLLKLTSGYFVIVSLGQQLRILAEKNLRFSVLAAIEITSALTGFCVAVFIAVVYQSVFALVFGLLSAGGVGSILFWVFLSNGWRPALVLKLGEVLKFIRYGGYAVLSNMINAVNSQVDVLIGGRLFGVDILGFYTLPRELSLRLAGIINPIVVRVGLPVLAKVQDDPERLNSIYLKTIRMTSSINFPCYLFMAAFAEEIIFLVFGPDWGASVIYLRIFSIWCLLRSTGSPVGSLLYSTGNVRLAFLWNLSLLIFLPVIFYWAGQWGPVAIATAMTATMFVLVPLQWFFLVRKICQTRFGEFHAQIAIPFCVALPGIGAAWWVGQFIDPPILSVLAGFIVGASVYVLLSWRFNREWFLAMMHLLGVKNL